MTIKRFSSTEPSEYTDHVTPVVQIPQELRALLCADDVARIEQKAMAQYRAAKAALDEAIVHTAIQDKGALTFAQDMSKKILVLIDIAAELGLIKDNGININQHASQAQLEQAGVPQEGIAAQNLDLLSELKRQFVKTKLISETQHTLCIAHKENTSEHRSMEQGNIHEAGFTGFSPLAIQHASEGNLREQMYIPYKTTHSFTKALFDQPDHVRQINERLHDKGFAWQLNTQVIDELKSIDPNLYAYGTYAKSRDGSRVQTTKEFRQNYQNNNPEIRSMGSQKIPLSSREILSQSGDLSPQSTQKIKWIPGKAYSSVLTSTDHPSVKAAAETGDLMLTGISGTTDSILTLGHMLGMFDEANKEQRMRDGLVACLGWMIDAKDHTAHEIQTSAKSFGLDYTAGPESYKQIRPGDADFLKQLKQAQKALGFKMPDEYLSAKYARELAKQFIKTNPIDEQKENIDPNIDNTSNLKDKQKAYKREQNQLRNQTDARSDHQVILNKSG